MPNKFYERGRRYENKIVNDFKTNGCISFRSAGSHSPIDVVGIDELSKTIYLIQCKTGKKKFKKEQKEFNKIDDNYKVVWKWMHKVDS